MEEGTPYLYKNIRSRPCCDCGTIYSAGSKLVYVGIVLRIASGTVSSTIVYCDTCWIRLCPSGRTLLPDMSGVGPGPVLPIPLKKEPVESTALFLTCPMCSERHIDRGEFATKPHHTHACQKCGLTWRPAIGPTVGVEFLPGFKNSSLLGGECVMMSPRSDEPR